MESKATIAFTVILVTLMGAGLIPMASADGVTVSIGSGSAAKGETAVVPLMIYNVSNLGSAVVNLTYNDSVVNVTEVSNSDFDQPPNLYRRGPGWVLLQAGQFMNGLTGDVKMCDVTLEAVGNEGTTSSLDLTDVKLEDMAMTPITVDSIVNGTFTVLDKTPPKIVGVSANPYYIANDGAMESQINVTVIDYESAVDTVKIDLSPIGYGIETMTPMIDNETWGITVNSTIEGIHQLYINATDIYGNSNTSEYVELAVIQPPTVTIEDGMAMPGDETTVPLMINGIPSNASVGAATVNLTFNEAIVNVTAVSNSDFDQPPNLYTRGPGWVLLQAGQFTAGIHGDVKMCDVTLKAVGSVGETSPLNLTDVHLEDMQTRAIPFNVHNGTFRSGGDIAPPVVENATASLSVIPDDTDNNPTWGESSQLNVTVTDESNITSVTINLSAIGGSAVQAMTNIPGTNIWTVITNASAGTAGWNGSAYVPYELQVNATDEYGNSNTSVCVELTVMKNGDTTGDGIVDFMHDGLYLVRHTLNVPGYEELPVPNNIADVTGDGIVDFMHDGLYLVRHTLNVPGYTILR